MFNADVPTMDFAVVSDDVTRVLTYYGDAVDVRSTVKGKVEDLLTRFDDLTGNVESLRSDCGPLSDNDFNNLIR